MYCRSQGNEAESDSVNDYESDGGQPAVSVEDNDGQDDRVADDTVAILQLRLQLAREQHRAHEELRKVRESEERLGQERTQRDAQGPTDTGRQPGVGMDLRDIMHFCLQCMSLTIFLTIERALELNGVERVVWARLLPA